MFYKIMENEGKVDSFESNGGRCQRALTSLGTLFLVSTPIGNRGDITHRAIEVLKSVDYIAAEDSRHSTHLLESYGILNSKMLPLHKFNESNNSIVSKLESGMNVALISDAGTPCISDPGALLVSQASSAGIDIVAIPGPSAVVTALSVSGYDDKEWAFLSFFPKENRHKKRIVDIMKSSINLFVFYESPLRAVDSLQYLGSIFGDMTCVVCRELTKKFETVYRGDILSVIQSIKADNNHTKGEYTVVVQPNYKVPLQQAFSYEAMIVDCMTRGLSIKDSILQLSNNGHPKNALYRASLNLKCILDNEG